MGGHRSEISSVFSGVPQGSVLGFQCLICRVIHAANHSSVIYVTVEHTQLLANHSSGRLQFATPIQTERSDEGG